MRLFILIIATLSLVACSGGGGGSPSPNPPGNPSPGIPENTQYAYELEGEDLEVDLYEEVEGALTVGMWSIRWNQDVSGNIVGVFLGPWGSISISGLDNGTTRVLTLVPENPLGPNEVDELVMTMPSGELTGTITVNFEVYSQGSLVHTQALYPEIKKGGDEEAEGGGGIGGITNLSEAVGTYVPSEIEVVSNMSLPQSISHWGFSGQSPRKYCTIEAAQSFKILLSQYLIFTYKIDLTGSNEVEETLVHANVSTDPSGFSLTHNGGYPSANIGGSKGYVYAQGNSNFPFNGNLNFEVEGDFSTVGSDLELSMNLKILYGTDLICEYNIKAQKQ